MEDKRSRRQITRAGALLFTIGFFGCGGKSDKNAGPVSDPGAAAGAGGTSGSGGVESAGGNESGGVSVGAAGGSVLGGAGGAFGGSSGDAPSGGTSNAGSDGGSGVSGTAAGGALGSVDALGACRDGLDYFITIAGDLPPSKVTHSCSDDAAVTMVPAYNEIHGLDPSQNQRPALVGCDGTERLEVWRFPPGDELLTAGYYVSSDGTKYSTCGASRSVNATRDCSPLGSLEVTPRADDRSVLEGSYAMTLFDGSGKSYEVSGDFRVCAYFE